jgi:GWxTD domain-containing protein
MKMGSNDFLWYLAVLSCRSLGLACLAWVAMRVLRVKSASVKHAVWTVVTALMLVEIAVSPALPSVPLRVLAPAPDAAPTVTPQLDLPPIPVPLSNSARRHLAITWREVVIGIYAVVAFALLIQLSFGYLLARRLVRNGKQVDWPRVRESETISVPMTVGQIAPAILLPMGRREWDPAKLQAVLGHEEAHIRRADWAIGVMARINCCVFWFHPLAWWLKRELALLAEYACDDSVLAQMGDRRQYARALLEIAYAMKSARGRLLRDAVPMAKETNVKKRMEQILDDTRTIPPAFGRRGWMTLLVCSLPVGYFASAVQFAPAQSRTVIPVAEPSTAVPQPAKQPARIIAQTRRDTGQPLSPQAGPTPVRDRAAVLASLETPYQKWLDEDVVYIISDDERRAFRRLQTDDEREQFISQFWLRRDPTPGTPENEFKVEHYRRIAFANDNFTAGIPGWKTDRGMVYMRYGPPDAIDSHAATPSTYPYQIWRYADPGGFGPTEFEFVDPTMTGRYHLTKDPSEKEVGAGLIKRGEILIISVVGASDLGRTVIVDPDGNVNFPLVGTVKAEGLTLWQFSQTVRGALSTYISNPQVEARRLRAE